MTKRAFLFEGKIDPARLAQFVAVALGRDPAAAMIYEDARDVDGPYDARAAGRLWTAFETSAVRIYLSQYDDQHPGTPGWFAVETDQVLDNDFEDRPVARAVAEGLGRRIIFRDPEPDPRDSPFVEASMISIDPDGAETKLWVVERTEGDGETVVDLFLRSEIFPD